MSDPKPQLILKVDTSTAVPSVSPPVSMNTATVSRLAPGRKIEASSPGTKDEQTFIDEFGFQLRDESQISEELKYVRSIDGEQVKRREVKWESMASDWSRTNEQMWEKMKARCRKGIPSRMRGVAWQLLVGSQAKLKECAGVFPMLAAKKPDEDTTGLIERDLARTFPSHALFRDQDGVGQNQMRRILYAYNSVDPEVSYVQGMGFLVATLLTQMGEEEAFWCFHEMMQQNLFAMRELFRPNFPMLQLCFFQLKKLMGVHCPKVLAHLDSVGVDVSIFASQWFMTLFVYHFPFRAVMRLWDIFLCEGWKIVFRVAIVLLKGIESKILGQPIDVCMKCIKTCSDDKHPDKIIDEALTIKFKTEALLIYRKEYEEMLRQQAAPAAKSS